VPPKNEPGIEPWPGDILVAVGATGSGLALSSDQGARCCSSVCHTGICRWANAHVGICPPCHPCSGRFFRLTLAPRRLYIQHRRSHGEMVDAEWG